MHRFLKLSLSFIFTLTLTGCFDMGSFGSEGHSHVDEGDYEEYYKAYYDAIDDIHLYSQDKSYDTYSLMDDFFNAATVNDMKSSVEPDEYIFMAFDVKTNLTLEALSMYVKADENSQSDTKLDVYLYVLNNHSFSNICSYADDDVFKKNNDNEYIYDIFGKKIFKEYDLPSKDSAISSASVKISPYVWSSFMFSNFNGERSIEIYEGQCIVICFYNNTGYQNALNKEATSESEKRQKVSITLTNLIMKSK